VSTPLEALLATGQIGAYAVLTQSLEATRVALELRERVKPGDRILLAQQPERSVWAKLSGLLSARAAPLSGVDLLARALLISGLEEPQVVMDTPELVAVAARVPVRPDALDHVFLDKPRNR